jgi:replication factor C subunit 3/5
MGRELLLDKYRPKSLDDLTYNHDVNTFFKAVATRTDMPHLIVEGPRGSGKRLRVELYLREKYGDFRINHGILNLDVPGKTESKAVHTLYSKYHHQFNPSIHNIYDRSLMQCFISEIVQTQLLVNIPYRIIIVEDADLLSVEAQESLRRTLEKCVHTCRFIFLVNNEDHIIAPLYSRCITVKVPAPTVTEITDILSEICVAENREAVIPELGHIASACNRDLHKSLNTLNKFILDAGDETTDAGGPARPVFSRTDYDDVYRYCHDMVSVLIKGQTIVGAMDKVRSLLYELVNFCVDCRALLPILLDIVLNKLPESAHNERYQLTKMASERDLSIRNSSKEIYHVENYCLHILRVIKVLMLTKKRSIPSIKKK